MVENFPRGLEFMWMSVIGQYNLNTESLRALSKVCVFDNFKIFRNFFLDLFIFQLQVDGVKSNSYISYGFRFTSLIPVY